MDSLWISSSLANNTYTPSGGAMAHTRAWLTDTHSQGPSPCGFILHFPDSLPAYGGYLPKFQPMRLAGIRKGVGSGKDFIYLTKKVRLNWWVRTHFFFLSSSCLERTWCSQQQLSCGHEVTSQWGKDGNTERQKVPGTLMTLERLCQDWAISSLLLCNKNKSLFV